MPVSARKQCRRHGIGGKQPADLVGHKRRRILWPAGIAHLEQGGKARCCLDDVVISLPFGIGAIRAKACAMNIDNFGVHRLQRLITKAKPLHPRHAHIMEKDIGFCRQSKDSRLVLCD